MPVLVNPPPSVSMVIGDTNVFPNGAPPLAWTDLDLSAVVGARESLVMLKITPTNAGNGYGVRRNGDVDVFDLADGMTGATPLINTWVGLLVATDAAGIIEWIATGNWLTTVDVMGYIN